MMSIGLFALAVAAVSPPSAQDYQALVHRLDAVEAENAELRRRVDGLLNAPVTRATETTPDRSTVAAEPLQRAPADVVRAFQPWDHAYAGVQIGLNRQRLRYAPTTGVDSLTSQHNTAPSGGLQVGRRWQNGLLVVGLEADGRYVGLNFDHPQQASNGFTSFHRREQVEADLVGQIGMAIGPSLVYGLGGISVSRVRYFSTGLYPTDPRHSNLVSATVGLGLAHKVARSVSVEFEGRLIAPGQLTGFDEYNPGPINGLVGARITNQKQATIRINYLLP